MVRKDAVSLTWWRPCHTPQMVALSRLPANAPAESETDMKYDTKRSRSIHTLVAVPAGFTDEDGAFVYGYVRYELRKKDILILKLVWDTNYGNIIGDKLVERVKSKAVPPRRRQVVTYVSEYNTLRCNFFKSHHFLSRLIKTKDEYEILFFWDVPEVVSVSEFAENEGYTYGELDFLD